MSKMPLIGTAATVIAIVVCCLGYAVFFRPLPFDSTSWKTNKALRPRMIDDLLAQNKLTGATKAEIDALLGAPSGQDSAHEDRYVYWAGTDGIIDDMWLELEFENDVVETVRYVPD